MSIDFMPFLWANEAVPQHIGAVLTLRTMGARMGLLLARKMPGQADVNDTFSKNNIDDTLGKYETISDENGDYPFGALTALHCKLDDNEVQTWLAEITSYYPPDAQDEIKAAIIRALTGGDTPKPIQFTWKAGKAKAITVSYDADHLRYTIVISGYHSPLKALLRARRKSKG